jgi:hypothetical protein
MKEAGGKDEDNWKGKDKKITYLGLARAVGRNKRTTFVGELLWTRTRVRALCCRAEIKR